MQPAQAICSKFVYKSAGKFTIYPYHSNILVTIVPYDMTCKQQRSKPSDLTYTLSFLSLFSLFKKGPAAIWEVAAGFFLPKFSKLYASHFQRK